MLIIHKTPVWPSINSFKIDIFDSCWASMKANSTIKLIIAIIINGCYWLQLIIKLILIASMINNSFLAMNFSMEGSRVQTPRRVNVWTWDLPLTIRLAELVPTITPDFTKYMKILRSDGASTNDRWIRTPPPENPCNVARGEKTQTRYSIAVNRKPPLGTGRVQYVIMIDLLIPNKSVLERCPPHSRSAHSPMTIIILAAIFFYSIPQCNGYHCGSHYIAV